MKLNSFLSTVALGMALAVPNMAAAEAASFNFTYTQTFCSAGGTGLVCPANGVAGSGSFSFANGLTTIGLANLTSFTFTDIIGNVSDRVTFTLANLTSFSAVATAGATPTLTSLILATTNVGTTTTTAGRQALSISSLAFQGVSLRSQGNAGSINSAGQLINISYSAVPEPSSLLGLLGISALGGFTLLRRRRFQS